LHGHTSTVSSLAFVPSTDLVVSGSWDGSCRVWSANKGREVGAQMKNGDQVRAVAVWVDGEIVAHGGDDGRIIICGLGTRKEIIDWDTGHGRVLSLSFSSDGRLASGHEDGNVVVWNPSTGAPTAGPFKLYAISVAFSPSGDRIATGGADGTIRVVYSHSGEDVIPAIQAHSDYVLSVVWSPNGQQIISASDDRTIKFWNSSDGSLLATCQGHTHYVFSIAISSDGEVLASASWDKTIRLWVWSTNEGREVGAQMKNGDEVNAVAVSLDGETVAHGGDDGRIIICKLHTRKKIIEWNAGHGRVLSLSFSSDGRLASGHEDGNVVVWNASTGAPTAGPFKLHDVWVNSVSFSPSGDRIATGSNDRTIRVVYSHSGEDVIPAIQAHSDYVLSVVWSP
ncbi:hypothetical protein HYDPIDRAFT_59451, partial [Hydnomerulius pinastri MD-312]